MMGLVPAASIILLIRRINFDSSGILSGDRGPHSLSSDLNAGAMWRPMTGCTLVGSSGVFSREWCDGGDLYMIAQAAGLMRRPRAFYLPSRAAVRMALSFP